MGPGEFFLHPQVWPLTVAMGLFLVVTLLEIAAVFTGVGADYGLDLSVDVDLPDLSAHTRLFDWLGLGRVPFLISLAAFLLCLSMIGLTVQALLFETIGIGLPAAIAFGGAAMASLPPVRLLNHALGKVWPKDETTAVEVASNIGREADVILGSVSTHEPGQIKFRDASGHTHHAMAYADQADETYQVGDPLLIVGRRGGFYVVIRHPNPSHDEGHSLSS